MICTLNIGTSSLKYGIFTDTPPFSCTIKKVVDFSPDDHTAIQQLLSDYQQDVTAIGIRVVHGGARYTESVQIDTEVLDYLQSIQELAPLHLPVTLSVIKTIKSNVPSLPIIAVFDTSFHHTMPEKAYRYAVPNGWEELYGVRRYGFHGLAHQSMRNIYCEELQRRPDEVSIITTQLGSGCSMCAMKDGSSIDTSMGFSPLEGLISRTRSGDIDPTVITYISKMIDVHPHEVIHQLNTQSGLAGLSNTDGDIRSIHSSQVLAPFIYRIQKYLGSYDAVLHKAEAFIFGGGISENNIDSIRSIFDNSFLDVSITGAIDQSKQISRISSADSRPVYIVSVDEEVEIAKQVNCTLTLKE